MDNIDQIKNILATTQTNIPILSFVVGLLATILGLIFSQSFYQIMQMLCLIEKLWHLIFSC